MAHSHRAGPGQVQATGLGAVGPNILCGNVHTDPRQGKEPGSIVFYYAAVRRICPGVRFSQTPCFRKLFPQ